MVLHEDPWSRGVLIVRLARMFKCANRFESLNEKELWPITIHPPHFWRWLVQKQTQLFCKTVLKWALMSDWSPSPFFVFWLKAPFVLPSKGRVRKVEYRHSENVTCVKEQKEVLGFARPVFFLFFSCAVLFLESVPNGTRARVLNWKHDLQGYECTSMGNCKRNLEGLLCFCPLKWFLLFQPFHQPLFQIPNMSSVWFISGKYRACQNYWDDFS